jgi:hypothetical protein
LHSYEKIDLGHYRRDTYFLAGFVRPAPTQYGKYDPDEDAHEYGVTLVCSARTPMDDNTEIVRLDNAHGQMPHVDRVYLPHSAEENDKRKLDESWTYSKMRTFLLDKWQRHADLYRYYDE